MINNQYRAPMITQHREPVIIQYGEPMITQYWEAMITQYCHLTQGLRSWPRRLRPLDRVS